MKKLFTLYFILPFVCYSQSITPDIFQEPLNTGANMSALVDISEFNQFEGGQIGAFYDLNEDGLLECVGLQEISQGFFGFGICIIRFP